MTIIYEPKGRAREYAALACNVYTGCDHSCVYCFAPAATYSQREKFTQPRLRPNYLETLEKEAAKLKTTERVLLSFTCDPYQAFDVKHRMTRQTIETLHRHNIAVQVLTKGGKRALRDLDLFGKQDAFATTLTFLDAAESERWEPGAASPNDRIATIRDFHEAGIETWVSLEPVLNPLAALEIISETAPIVDLYKVGKLNYHPLAKSIDWGAFARVAVDLLEKLGKRYYIKNDLKAYL